MRDRVSDQLLALKKHYGKFIENHEMVLRLMKSDRAGNVTRRCAYAYYRADGGAGTKVGCKNKN